jgi:hypothetical protein
MSIGKEMILLRSRIAEAKKRLGEMECRADSYISIIRDIIDPYGGEYTEFNMDRALVMMNDFHRIWTDARELKVQLARMEKDLNG